MDKYTLHWICFDYKLVIKFISEQFVVQMASNC